MTWDKMEFPIRLSYATICGALGHWIRLDSGEPSGRFSHKVRESATFASQVDAKEAGALSRILGFK